MKNAVYRTSFEVIAYDESGYGDNRSRDFTDGAAAVEYAKSLDDRFHPIVVKRTTMETIVETIYDSRNPEG